MNNYFEEEFDKINTISRGEYDNCTFRNCDFSNVDLSHFIFAECEFIECNLTMTKLVKSSWRDVRFKNCKLVGLHFQDCQDFLFGVRFENCSLNLASFYQRNLKKTLFRNCSLHETDFTESDLSQAIFDNCDLKLAIFDNSILEKADFRTSFNYSLNPEINRIKKARFSLQGIAGLLSHYDILIE
jgi:fluoroquinolone resistance protein